MKISLSAARKLAIISQGLDGSFEAPTGKEGVAQTIERIRYVQIDTISVVQRAHHHTLWSRCPDYDPQMLHELQAQDRRVFEYWAHAASYLPMRDFRYYLSRMRAFQENRRTRQWLEDNREVVRGVIERIREEGPLRSKDFEAPEGFERGTWWHWKPAKRALETLFLSGELMVSERRGFQKLYDLPERVLPSGLDTTPPDPEEQMRFTARNLLVNHGVASLKSTPRWVSTPWWVRDSQALARGMRLLVDSGEARPVEVEGWEESECYALAEALELAESEPASLKPLHILSPFDNLIGWRGHLKRLFGFDGRLECYLPAPQRQYGYFCLPLLWGGEFIGRLDPKADRKSKTFTVKKLVFEPEFQDYDALLPVLAGKLYDFARFNGCERVVSEQAEPERVKEPLNAWCALRHRRPLNEPPD